jgi:hypothetical protein
MGSITFASNNTEYTLGTTFKPTSLLFYGVAVDSSLYTFTITENANASVGAVYQTSNGARFTVTSAFGFGDTTLYASGTTDPNSSGSLVKQSGGGETDITYSGFSAPGTATVRGFGIGNAQLGPSYYFQPATGTSVRIGGPLQDIIQSSSSVTTGASGTRTTVSETRLFRVGYPSNSIADLKATATVMRYSNDGIVIKAELADGWSIVGNYVVT